MKDIERVSNKIEEIKDEVECLEIDKQDAKEKGNRLLRRTLENKIRYKKELINSYLKEKANMASQIGGEKN